MRQEPTDAERKLWRTLREMKPLGFHFRRQAPFRSYILDFVEHRRRLVIELDGGQHGETVHRVRDAIRDQALADEGYRVLRFWNHDVFRHFDGVVGQIYSVLRDVETDMRRHTSEDIGRRE